MNYYCRASKKRKFIFAVCSVMLVFFSINQTVLSACADSIGDNGSIRAMVQKRTGVNFFIREIEFNILSFLSEVIDYFQDAVDTITSVNLYTMFVQSKFNTSNIYPLAWTLFSLALIILGIIFIWNNDKIKISESAKSILMSAIMILALPTVFSALGDLKTAGIDDVNINYGSNNFTLGQQMLMKSIIYLPGSTDGDNGKMTFDKSPLVENAISGAGRVYEAGEDVLDPNAGRIPKWKRKEIMYKLGKYVNTVSGHDNIGSYISDDNGTEIALENAPSGDWEKIVASIKNLGYPEEMAYTYYIDFWFNVVLMCVTVVCLIFAGIKLANMLFDIMFVQIIAPIVAASDLNGSGRAKKIIQHILSTYIIFIVVILILKLYLIVMQGLRNSSYGDNFAVLIIFTIAGAKFVVDGPDIIVQILGIDAGVKSGITSTLMGLHSAAQIAGGTVRGTANVVRNVAAAPVRAGGFIGDKAAAVCNISQAEGAKGKMSALIGNTKAGQAFKTSHNNREWTNDNYSSQQIERAKTLNQDVSTVSNQSKSSVAASSKAVTETKANTEETPKMPQSPNAENIEAGSADNKNMQLNTQQGRAFNDIQNTSQSNIANEPFAQTEIKTEAVHRTFADMQREEEK